MKFLYKNLTAFVAGGLGYFAEVRTDGSHLYVTVFNTDHTVHSVSGKVVYNGDEQLFSLSSVPEEILVFDYTESVKSLAVTVDGSRLDCSWHGSANDPAPAVALIYTGFRMNSDFKASFVYSGDAENCALVAPMISYLDGDTWETIDYTPSKRTGATFSQYISSDMPSGTPYKVTLLFACYDSPSDATDEYIGLTEYTLPKFVLTDAGTPLAPNGLTYAPRIAGEPFTVSWNPVNDPEFRNIFYVVTRRKNRQSESVVYGGTGTSFTDTLPAGTQNVLYYINSLSGGVYSAINIGEEVEITPSNVFVGIDGRAVAALSIYIGSDGVPALASPTVFVG